MPSVMWFRRDLRVRDHPALLAAIAASPGGVVPLYVIDPILWHRAGEPRRAYLAASLRSLDE
ncbi:MAG: deoxyribodipyrimidine photo-lyase, partial [Nocardioides sp.]